MHRSMKPNRRSRSASRALPGHLAATTLRLQNAMLPLDSMVLQRLCVQPSVFLSTVAELIENPSELSG